MKTPEFYPVWWETPRKNKDNSYYLIIHIKFKI